MTVTMIQIQSGGLWFGFKLQYISQYMVKSFSSRVIYGERILPKKPSSNQQGRDLNSKQQGCDLDSKPLIC